MDYASQQRNPTRNTFGIGVVVLMHIVLGWALLNGLARKVVEVIKAPIETKIIEEVKPPPPPPPENLPPPPKLKAPPPPSFVPPPEIKVAPPPKAPVITVTKEAPPPAPPVSIAPAPAPTPAPPAPAAPPAPPAPPAPKFTAKGVTFDAGTAACKPEYEPAALRAQVEGTTRVKLTLDATGKVVNAELVESSGRSREHRALDRAAMNAFTNPGCTGKPGNDDTGKPIGGTKFVDYVWKIE